MQRNNEDQRLIESENDPSNRLAHFAALADLFNSAASRARLPGGYAGPPGEEISDSNSPSIVSGTSGAPVRQMSLLSSFNHANNNHDQTPGSSTTSSANSANDPNGNPPKYRDYFLPMEPKRSTVSGIFHDSGRGTVTEDSDLEEKKYRTVRKWVLKDGKPVQIYEEQIPTTKKSGPLNTGIPPKFRALGWPSWKKDVPYPIGQLPLLVHTCENKPADYHETEDSMDVIIID